MDPGKIYVFILDNSLLGNTLNSALCKEMATNRPIFINIISYSKLNQMLTQNVIFFVVAIYDVLLDDFVLLVVLCHHS